MAEIRVQQRKKNYGWVWLVLLLVIIAAVVYYLYLNGSLNFASAASDARTSVASVLFPLVPSLTGGLHGSA